ncbi:MULTISPECIES: cytochrome c [unclassified Azospirillum]|uniref:c-type cytochrome n=1 Tax=unclassified Azospirillum TaxID=2630922 RepID=UPI000B6B0E2A|nr:MULTISPECIES: cytochrome c [unclassified Azospirillum]SNT18979.1 Cytochrome c, mono- and diheme variants [Azospirillum sp. RU38E]SNT30969.1 Cytochrome c, mono- and diheme variants [Azospirillum sp. RU37A]
MKNSLLSLGLALLALGAALPASAQRTDAQTSDFADARRFPYQDGEHLYRSICQGCHMPDGKGATGAGTYPALASNANLEAAGYPVHMVVNGQRAMPSFGYLSDDQVSAVVNYVRSHFGNHYSDAVTAQDVKDSRPTR